MHLCIHEALLDAFSQHVRIAINLLVVVAKGHYGEGACVASKQAVEAKEHEGSGSTHSPHRFYFSHGSSGVAKLLFGSPRHPHLATSHDLLSSIH